MKKTFRYSICEPLNPTIVEKGKIEQEEIIATLEAFPWESYLLEMNQAEQAAIHYSPSLEFENQTNEQGLSISAVGTPEEYEFYIFYKRPKALLESGVVDKDYWSDLTGQTLEDAKIYLEALMKDDQVYLEEQFTPSKKEPLQNTRRQNRRSKRSFFQRLKQFFA
ncbi:MAG: hypothetical protein ACRBFS_21195 [Aureispira sp.]